VVTVGTAYSVTTTGLTWAIGGKRLTLSSSLQLFLGDILALWTVILNNTTAFTTSATLNFEGAGGAPTTGSAVVKGNSTAWGSQTIIRNSANNAVLGFVVAGSSYIKFQNINLQNSNSGATANGLQLSRPYLISFENCVFGDATNKINSGLLTASGSSGAFVSFRHCEFKSCKAAAINIATTITSIHIEDCYIHGGAAGGGFTVSANVAVSDINIHDSIIAGNTGKGIDFSAVTSNSLTPFISNNIIDSNTTTGVDLSSQGGNFMVYLFNNQITNNATGIVGLTSSTVAGALAAFADYNNVWNNTTNYSNFPTGAHDTSVNPNYQNTGSGNYTPSGTTLNTGYPDKTLPIGGGATGSLSYVTPGAIQPLGDGTSSNAILIISAAGAAASA
jgi:hypothetical protein